MAERSAPHRALGREFRLMVGGQAVSQLGSRVFGIAYMLWVLAATGSAVQAGAVATVMLAVFPLAQVPAGWLADHLDRRRIMLACDGLSATAAGSIAVAAWQAGFHVVHLAVAGAVLSAGWAVRGTAEGASLARLVAADDLTRASSVVQARSFATALAGPPLAGLLFGVDPALPFVLDAASYVVALGATAAIRPPLGPVTAPDAGARRPVWRGIADGWAAVRRDALLRRTTVLAALVNLAVNAFGLVVITGLDRTGHAPATTGLVLAAGMAGGLVGALLGRRLHRLARTPRRLLAGAPLVAAAAVLALGGLTDPVGIGVAYFAFLAAVPAWQSYLSAQWVRRTPDGLRGRVLSTALLLAALPASVAPAVVGDALTAHPPWTVCAVLGGLLVAVSVAAATSRAVRALPVEAPPPSVSSPAGPSPARTPRAA